MSYCSAERKLTFKCHSCAGTLEACCEANFSGGSCDFVDICNPPEPIETSVPTYSPTFESSYGSTPTVSKETTGPPTMLNARPRSGLRSNSATYGLREEADTQCQEIRAGNPQVCVNVCTVIVSVFDGDTLLDESATTTESECIDG